MKDIGRRTCTRNSTFVSSIRLTVEQRFRKELLEDALPLNFYPKQLMNWYGEDFDRLSLGLLDPMN